MVRDRVARGKVAFDYTPTSEMGADGFTKPLPVAAFAALRSLPGVRAQEHAKRARRAGLRPWGSVGARWRPQSQHAAASLLG